MKHINTGACDKLGGESFVRKPLDQEEAAALQTVAAAAHATENSDPALPPPECELPLVQRPSFRAQVHRWASWPLQPGARTDLLERCVLCYMWLASSKHVKQHMNTVHRDKLGDIPDRAVTLCRTFKSQLTRGRSCVYCKSVVGAPGRHSTQCTALYQVSTAALYVHAHYPQHGGGQSGGGNLPPLFSQPNSAAAGAGELHDLANPDSVGDAATTPEAPAPRLPKAESTGLPVRDLPSPASVLESVLESAGEAAAATPGHEQAASSARGSDQQSESGSGNGALPQGGCQEHPTLHDEGNKGAECPQGSGGRSPHLSASHRSAGEHDQGTTATHADDLATPEGRASLQKPKWMTEGGDWRYMQWCRKTKTLVPNEAKHPLTHAEAVRVLNSLSTRT